VNLVPKTTEKIQCLSIFKVFMIFSCLLVFSALSEAGISIVGGLTREVTVKPGETYDGVVILRNTIEQPSQVKIYQTDYLFFADGRNIYGEPGKLQRSNANWLTFNPSRVTVPPKSEVPIHYPMKVPLKVPEPQSLNSEQKASETSDNKSQSGEQKTPDDKSSSSKSEVSETSDDKSQSDEQKAPGDKIESETPVLVPLTGTYWSMLMVELLPESHPEAEGAPEGKVGVGILQVMRYGVQFVTHIGDSGSRKIKFLSSKLVAQEGKRLLQIDIENIGERWVKPIVWVELYDEKGALIGRFESAEKRIYPGTSVRHLIDLTEVPEGKYKALIVADSGGKDVWGAQYTLKF